MRKVFEHAWILTMDEQFTAIRDGWLLVNGKNIEAMGEGPFPGECDERIDARGGILLPGFTTATQVANEVTVAETIIVGDVPDTYTYFGTDAASYREDLKDYVLNNS